MDQIDLLIDDITRRLSVTSIVVTHDLFSVYTIAHRIAMMHDGKIYFQGTPEELLAQYGLDAAHVEEAVRSFVKA